MTRLQEDIREIYNSLTEFSTNTLMVPSPTPIKVDFSPNMGSLSFEQRGTKISLSSLNYYCKNLRKLKDTYLLPVDYDILMSSLEKLINGGSFINPRVCISPIDYGFEVYETPKQSTLVKEGPHLVGTCKFVSGNSWIFKKLIKLKNERL